MNLAVDFGPLLVFFLAYRYFSPPKGDNGLGAVVAVTKSTIAFMVATVVALAVSKWRLGKISPMLWLSTVLILAFGALTVWLGDPDYIQMKPTAVYLLFAGILFGGLLRGKAMLRTLLQSAFDGLDDAGWLKLSRNWAVFFLVLAVVNEILRHFYNKSNGGFETWLWIKVWGVTALSFLFTFAQVPMLLRHGLGEDAENEVLQDPPHD
ncbi:inner membrane-spanning protein YciB [Novosphingobium lentum]|uniref:inner membrane-spanning protein YciB n=1 Tax=Novosphingobium lentum TaxID=145287 RepID=UPI000830EC0A|nr:inner membrane-spanning protein YciB [Novosphingobium lentum]